MGANLENGEIISSHDLLGRGLLIHAEMSIQRGRGLRQYVENNRRPQMIARHDIVYVNLTCWFFFLGI